jgi:hypothetical protein
MRKIDPVVIMSALKAEEVGERNSPERLLRKLDRIIKRAVRETDRSILQIVREAVHTAYRNVEGDTAPSTVDFLDAIIYTYICGSIHGTRFITRFQVERAATERAKKNAHWVQLFNKAIRQAHSEGLTGQNAVNAACKSLDGTKIPVGNKALRSREHELRTGKKRRK